MEKKITVLDQRVWAPPILFCYKNELTGIRIDRSGYNKLKDAGINSRLKEKQQMSQGHVLCVTPQNFVYEFPKSWEILFILWMVYVTETFELSVVKCSYFRR